MRIWISVLSLAFAGSLPLQAGVYADFSLSRGGEALGTVTVRLFHERAPRVCANFIGLATGDRPWLDPRTNRVREGVPFYDGLIFHRLVHDFVIQGGDPLGTGAGGPGYVFQDQFHPELRHDGPYLLSMAHAGAHTNGSQFFITLDAAPFLDDLHSVFGEVIEGRGIIDGFADPEIHPVDDNNRPLAPIVMESVVVRGAELEAFTAEHAEAGLPRWERVIKKITHRSEESEEGDMVSALRLHWHRRAQWDYPVLGSQDLEEWLMLGHGLSVDDDPDFSTEVTNVFIDDPERGLAAFPAFFQVLGLDYSHLPAVPQSVIQPGTEIRLFLEEGTVRLHFTGEEEGAWSFAPADGSAESSGEMDEFSQDPDSAVPESGFFIGGESTLATLLARRTVTVFFDEPVGPRGWTAIQPTFSFHEEGKGWFDGPVNAENPANLPFRGRFEVAFP